MKITLIASCISCTVLTCPLSPIPFFYLFISKMDIYHVTNLSPSQNQNWYERKFVFKLILFLILTVENVRTCKSRNLIKMIISSKNPIFTVFGCEIRPLGCGCKNVLTYVRRILLCTYCTRKCVQPNARSYASIAVYVYVRSHVRHVRAHVSTRVSEWSREMTYSTKEIHDDIEWERTFPVCVCYLRHL